MALLVTDSRTGQKYSLPIEKNAVRASEFKKIKESGRAGLKVYDEGLANTAVVTSSLTFMDASRGNLMFRGHSIEQLWDCDFEEILHLTLWSRLPSAAEKESFRMRIANEMMNVPPEVKRVVKAFPQDAAPVPVVLAALSTYVSSRADKIPATTGGNIYHGNEREINEAAIRTVAAWAVSIGLAISHRKGLAFTSASPDCNFFENLFRMMAHVEHDTGRPDPKKLKCFARFGAFSADHGMTNSTLALLVTCSALADPISGMISALAAGYGPLHFGAPECAYRTMLKIQKPENVPALIEKVKRGEQRLFGYGHRTYEVPDPRIKPIQKLLDELNADSNPLLAVAREIDRLASKDEYFVKRGIQANADLYGVFFYIAEGFTAEQIPLLMMTHRLPGIIAHWRDQMLRPIKIYRPSHIYESPKDVPGTAEARL